MDSSVETAADGLAQDRVYALIKDAITSARLRPGQRLRTDVLAQSVNASRTPVREALSRLAQGGLVERDDGWGYVVKHVGVKDVLDMYSVREALEMQAARELVPKLTPTIIAELRTLNRVAEASYAAGRCDEFLSRNRTFHNALAQETANALLQQMLGMINDRVRQIGSLIVQRYEPRLKELLLENRRIMTAIRNRDLNALLVAVQDHVRHSREQFLRLLADPLAANAQDGPRRSTQAQRVGRASPELYNLAVK